MGSWRPDFLVEDGPDGEENFRITEINARFSFNGFMHAAYGQQALALAVQGQGSEATRLVGATEPEMVTSHASHPG